MGARLSVIALSGVLLAACGPSVVGTPMASEGSGGIVGGTVVSDAGLSADSAASGGGTSTGVGDAGSSGAATEPDLPPPPDTFVACSDARATLDVSSAVTPEGPVVLADGFASYDYCSGAVYIGLMPEDAGLAGALLFLIDRDDGDNLYAGIYDTRGGGPTDVPSAADAVEFLQPWDASDAFDANANPTLQVRLELHEEGWDVSADVDVPFCADRAQCFCPCE